MNDSAPVDMLPEDGAEPTTTLTASTQWRLRGPSKRAKPWFALAAALLYASGAILALTGIYPPEEASDPLFRRFIAVVMLGLTVYTGRRAYRALQWRTFKPKLTLMEASFSLPPSPSAPSHVTVQYKDIEALSTLSTQRTRVMIITTAMRHILISSAQLGSVDRLTSLDAWIRTRILAQPGGRTRLQAFADQSRLAVRALSRQAMVTPALLAVLAGIFILEVLQGAPSSELEMIRLGANSAPLVLHGEWYRLLSANFLHANSVHILVNAFALWQLGTLLERVLGWQRFLAIYLGSALAGAAASTLFSGAAFSVGASTAIFGLLAAYFVLQRVYSNIMPAVFRQSMRWWIVIALVNASLPVVIPIIDSAAHLGGALGGAALALIVVPRGAGLLSARPPTWVAFFTAFWLALFAAGLAQATKRYVNDEPIAWAALVEAHPEPSLFEADMLNRVAWAAAIDPDTRIATLREMIRLSKASLRATPRQSAFIDTLATLHHRLGEQDQALTIQVEAVLRQPMPAYLHQLYRFAAAKDKDPTGSLTWSAAGATSDGPTATATGAPQGYLLVARWADAPEGDAYVIGRLPDAGDERLQLQDLTRLSDTAFVGKDALPEQTLAAFAVPIPADLAELAESSWLKPGEFAWAYADPEISLAPN